MRNPIDQRRNIIDITDSFLKSMENDKEKHSFFRF